MDAGTLTSHLRLTQYRLLDLLDLRLAVNDPPVVVGERRLGVLQPAAGQDAGDGPAPSAPYFRSPATDEAEAGSQKIPSRAASIR